MLSNTIPDSPLADLLTRLADDALIIGHRHSEWIGLGPMLEEDIALASIAQDKVGQAHTLYQILEQHCGAGTPDHVAFLREEAHYKCAHLTELDNGEYDTTITRHFLFDTAELIRYEALMGSSFAPLAQVARKFRGEIKYHVMHAHTWFKQLANGTEESRARMQSALNTLYPYALALFETTPHEDAIIEQSLFVGEQEVRRRWSEVVAAVVAQTPLRIPEINENSIGLGGRRGYHTEGFPDLLAEMGEVLRSDPHATW